MVNNVVAREFGRFASRYYNSEDSQVLSKNVDRRLLHCNGQSKRD